MVILRQTVDGQMISEDEAKELNSHERRRLLRPDPRNPAQLCRTVQS